jgi:hypothetical protein
MKTLGKLQQVDLRHYWADEARHFTPWLAQDENIEELCNTIGIDIEVEGTELFIGSFKADIVGRDIANNQKVIIENQLEKSNHDHLGKIITYASGLGASVIIWICRTITEEHRQAIDWLNQNTHNGVAFFALEIELWQIDNSNPAPKFNVICRPNEWVKTTQEIGLSKSLSDTRSVQLAYWNFVKEYFKEHDSFVSLRTPRASHRYSTSIGRSKFSMGLTANTVQNRLGCEIYIRGVDAKKAFAALHQDKDAIEQALQTKLQWQELPNRQDTRIILYHEGNIKDEATWPQSAEWFRVWAEAFTRVFRPRIEALIL